MFKKDYQARLQNLRLLLNYGTRGDVFTIYTNRGRNRLYIHDVNRGSFLASTSEVAVCFNAELTHHPEHYIMERFAKKHRRHFTISDRLADLTREGNFFNSCRREREVNWEVALRPLIPEPAQPSLQLDDSLQAIIDEANRGRDGERDEPMSADPPVVVSSTDEILPLRYGLYRYYRNGVIMAEGDMDLIREVMAYQHASSLNETANARVAELSTVSQYGNVDQMNQMPVPVLDTWGRQGNNF